MLKKAEISHEIETEKLDVDKRLKEICEIKETLLKIQQDLQDAIKAEGNASVVLTFYPTPTTPKPVCQNMGNHVGESSFRTDENVNRP